MATLNAAVNVLAEHFRTGPIRPAVRVFLVQPIAEPPIQDPEIRAVYEMDKHGISMRRQAPWVRRGFTHTDIVDGMEALRPKRRGTRWAKADQECR